MKTNILALALILGSTLSVPAIASDITVEDLSTVSVTKKLDTTVISLVYKTGPAAQLIFDSISTGKKVNYEKNTLDLGSGKVVIFETVSGPAVSCSKTRFDANDIKYNCSVFLNQEGESLN